MEITGDQPLAKLIYWSIRSTFCPEAYINIQVEPGHKFVWNYNYRFYELAGR